MKPPLVSAVGLGCVITRGGLSSIALRRGITTRQAAIAAIIGLMPTMFMARVRL